MLEQQRIIRTLLLRLNVKGATINELSEYLQWSKKRIRKFLHSMTRPFPSRRPKHQWKDGWRYYANKKFYNQAG